MDLTETAKIDNHCGKCGARLVAFTCPNDCNDDEPKPPQPTEGNDDV